MKKLVLALCLIAPLSGCASLWWAGVSKYEISPIVDPQTLKVIGCCTLTVYSGKEYASVNATFSKHGEDYDVKLDENDVLAFKGQAIAASAASDVAAAAAAAAVTALKQIK